MAAHRRECPRRGKLDAVCTCGAVKKKQVGPTTSVMEVTTVQEAAAVEITVTTETLAILQEVQEATELPKSEDPVVSLLKLENCLQEATKIGGEVGLKYMIDTLCTALNRNLPDWYLPEMKTVFLWLLAKLAREYPDHDQEIEDLVNRLRERVTDPPLVIEKKTREATERRKKKVLLIGTLGRSYPAYYRQLANLGWLATHKPAYCPPSVKTYDLVLCVGSANMKNFTLSICLRDGVKVETNSHFSIEWVTQVVSSL